MEIPHEKYIATFNGLPRVIRSYLVDGTMNPITEDIGKKYSFHVDLVGQFTTYVTYMLMGLMSPTELLGELVLLGVSADVAKNILGELNERIFIPMREQVKNQPPEDEDLDEEVTVNETEETQSAEKVSEPTPIPTTSVNQLTPPAPPTYVPPAPNKAPLVETPTLVPSIRTMSKDMEHIQHPELQQTASAPQQQVNPLHAVPASGFQTASIPVTFSNPFITTRPNPTPVPSTPKDEPSRTMPSQPQQVISESVQVPHNSVNVLRTEYGTDPYREPVE